jgi:hypothetical protein
MASTRTSARQRPYRRAAVSSAADEQPLSHLTEDPARRLSHAVVAASEAVGPEEFLARLNELRTEKDLTYDRIGRLCRRLPQLRLSRSGVHKLLTGKRLPSQPQVIAFLSLCDVSYQERVLWLTHLARTRAALSPDSIMRPPMSAEGRPQLATKAAEASRQHRNPTPSDPPAPEPRRYPWQYSLSVWMVCRLAVIVVAASASAIILTRLRLPTSFMTMIYLVAAGTVTLWTWSWPPPDPTHVKRYQTFEDPSIFESDESTAPPVIGE